MQTKTIHKYTTTLDKLPRTTKIPLQGNGMAAFSKNRKSFHINKKKWSKGKNEMFSSRPKIYITNNYKCCTILMGIAANVLKWRQLLCDLKFQFGHSNKIWSSKPMDN